MCLEFVPAGVSCLCPYDKMLPIGPVNLTHTLSREAARATGAARGGAGPSTAGPSEPLAPAGSSEGNNAQQTAGNSDVDAPGAPRLAAGPSVPRVNASCQIHYAGSTVPRKARTGFSDVAVETMRATYSVC